MRQFVVIVTGLLVFGLFAMPSANAHKIFKVELERKHEAEKLKVKSCNFCHVKGEKKTSRNDFGKMLEKHETFKGKEFSARHKKVHDDEDEAGEEKLEAEMIEAFKKALEDIEKMEPKKDGPTYGELIKTKKMEHLEEKDDDDE